MVECSTTRMETIVSREWENKSEEFNEHIGTIRQHKEQHLVFPKDTVKASVDCSTHQQAGNLPTAHSQGNSRVDVNQENIADQSLPNRSLQIDHTGFCSPVIVAIEPPSHEHEQRRQQQELPHRGRKDFEKTRSQNKQKHQLAGERSRDNPFIGSSLDLGPASEVSVGEKTNQLSNEIKTSRLLSGDEITDADSTEEDQNRLSETNITRSRTSAVVNLINISADTNEPDSHKTTNLKAAECETATGNRQNLGYQLRALSDKSEAIEGNLFQDSIQLADEFQLPKLSAELVNETLSYFVNCSQRLSQMTKTYDDSDAYILLLQEKEVDLELAARIGQDLLKQNKQLKDSIKNLEDELAKRHDDVQQLKHDLASKVNLLDTFIAEEEQQNSIQTQNGSRVNTYRDEYEDQYPSSNASTSLRKSNISSRREADDDNSRFLSLTQSQKLTCSSQIDPFTSLPYHVNSTSYNQHEPVSLNSSNNDSSQHQNHDDELALQKEGKSKAATESSSRILVESVTSQLVESNKRLCELQDELIFKGEQSLLQQEKIFRLEQQIRDSDRRLDDVAKENENLRQTIFDSAEEQRELSEELRICKKNFGELLQVFIELQKETRINKNLSQQNSYLATFYSELDPVNNLNNISFDSFAPSTSSTPEASSRFTQKVRDIHSRSTNDSASRSHNNQDLNNIDRCRQQSSEPENAQSFSLINTSNDNLMNSTTDIECCNLCKQITCEKSNHHFQSIKCISKTHSPTIISQKPKISEGEAQTRVANIMVTSTSLHEELRESMRNMGNSSEMENEEEELELIERRKDGAEEADDEADWRRQKSGARTPSSRSPRHRAKNQGGAQFVGYSCSSDQHSDSDGVDSGLHTTTNRSEVISPRGLNTDTDCDDFLSGGCGRSPESSYSYSSMEPARCHQDEDKTGGSWPGLSSFMIATLLLICLSASFSSSANTNLAHKIQQISKFHN